MSAASRSYTSPPPIVITARQASAAAQRNATSHATVEVAVPGQHPIQVALERTRVGFGGERLWLRCPACSRRCQRLHLLAEELRCVRCAGITPPGRRRHRDRQWEAWGRAAHRLVQVRAQLHRRYLRLARRGELERLAAKLERAVCAGLLEVDRRGPHLTGYPCSPLGIPRDPDAFNSSG